MAVASPALLASLTGGGIDLPALALALVALVGSAAFTLRGVRRRSTRKQQEAEPGAAPAGGRSAALFIAAAAIAVAAIAVAWQGAKRSEARTPILQLWLLPDRAAGPGALTIGVDSTGPAPAAYRLVLRSGSRPLRTWTELPLATGHWQATVEARGSGRVDAFLYRGAGDTPVRHVRLWLRGATRA